MTFSLERHQLLGWHLLVVMQVVVFLHSMRQSLPAVESGKVNIRHSSETADLHCSTNSAPVRGAANSLFDRSSGRSLLHVCRRTLA
jgi:hypothetical protein